MSTPAYSVRFRPDLNLVDTVMHGVLTLQQAEAYMDERAAGYARYRIRPGHLMRLDMGEHPAQSQDVVAYMDKRVRDFPIPGRIAVVTSSTIAKLQARRVVYSLDGNRRLFEDPAAALAWLLESPAV
jgi:hypothetical protein